MKNTGSENYGGPIVTAGGLVFIGATNFDKKFRAFDKSTGELLWETTLAFFGECDSGDLRSRWPAVCGDRRRRRERSKVGLRRRVRGVCAAAG